MAQHSLMEHQKDGVAFLESVDGIGALLWEPGVGKTGATLAWIDRLAARQQEVRVLVVAPLTAADTWVLQPPLFMDSVVKARMLEGATVDILQKIAVSGNWTAVPPAKIQTNHTSGSQFNSRVTILSMSAGALSSFCDNRTKVVRVLRAIRKYKPHVVIMDESHIIKSPTSNVSKAMYQIGQLAPHRIILTGTVNPHDPLDCYGQWRFLAPWTFSDQYGEPYTKQPLLMTRSQQAGIRPWPWGRFRDRYAAMGGYKGKAVTGVNPATITELHDRVAERSMAVLKSDALDLPPVMDMDVHVALNPREAVAYKEMAEELVAQMESGELVEAVNPLAKLMKLRQIAGGFVKDTDTGTVHVIGDSLRKAVKEVVEVTLAGEQRVVVFAYFRSECALLADMLKARGVTVELITGQTPAKDRLAIRQRFGDVTKYPKRTILVAQQRTMSMSVNELVTAQNAVYASMSERRDDWIQSRGRLDRNGQVGQHVTFWNCYTPGLIGDIMLNRHKDRGDLEAALLNHIREVAGSR